MLIEGSIIIFKKNNFTLIFDIKTIQFDAK